MGGMLVDELVCLVNSLEVVVEGLMTHGHADLSAPSRRYEQIVRKEVTSECSFYVGQAKSEREVKVVSAMLARDDYNAYQYQIYRTRSHGIAR